MTDDERDRFASQGFVVARERVAPEACDALSRALSEAIERVAAEYREGARAELGFWELMARSRDGIEVFWDPSRGSPAAGLEAATGRVGHALHAKDERFAAFCAQPPIRSGLAAVVGADGVVVQSAIIYKQARSDAVQFGLHQDAWYLTTEPESLALAFVALDDMDRENGCLEVLPGSHTRRLDRVLRMGPGGFESARGRPLPEPSRQGILALEIPKGTVVLLHGRTYHASAPNRSPRPRRALLVHAMSAASRLAPTTWISKDGAPPPLVPLSALA